MGCGCAPPQLQPAGHHAEGHSHRKGKQLKAKTECPRARDRCGKGGVGEGEAAERKHRSASFRYKRLR